MTNSKLLVTALVALGIACQTFAADPFKCQPDRTNQYFTDAVSVKILDSHSIEVNGVPLQIDLSYKPRTASTYKRYEGKTSRASEWSDSGVVEIYFDSPKKKLRFIVRGEMFIDEWFRCE